MPESRFTHFNHGSATVSSRGRRHFRLPMICLALAWPLVVLGALAPVASAAGAPNANCTGTLAPGTYGNVTVTGNCVTTSSDQIQGNLQVQQGGSLQDEATVIGGNLQANNALWVDLRGGSVGGDLQVQGLTASPSGTGDGATANDLCGLSVHGNVQVQNNGSGAPFDIGAAPDCTSGLTIGGNLQIQNNAGTVDVGSNVPGSLTFQSGNGVIGGLDSQVQVIYDSQSSDGPTPRPANIVAPNVLYATIPGTKWISVVPDADGGYYADYQTSFTLPTDVNSASLAVSLYTDNRTDSLSLNGNSSFGSQPAGCPHSNFQLIPAPMFSTSTGFVAGLNTLVFDTDNCPGVALNANNPTGLDFQGTVNYTTPLDSTTAQGNVQVQNNTGGGRLTDTSAGGNCQLQNNTQPFPGSSNTAKGNNSCNT